MSHEARMNAILFMFVFVICVWGGNDIFEFTRYPYIVGEDQSEDSFYKIGEE